MCLSTITKHKPCKRGFKVVTTAGDGKNYHPLLFHIGVNLPMGKWIDSKSTSTIHIHLLSTGESYKSGFHIFHHLRDARHYVVGSNTYERVVRVAVAGPIVVGKQCGLGTVTVAKRIKITSEVA